MEQIAPPSSSPLSPPVSDTGYDAGSIEVLDGLQAVRLRPGMYLGDVDTESGLFHLLKEVLDNAVDEAMAGHATKVEVRLHADGSCSVTDDGRGIPTGIHPQKGVSSMELALGHLHAGGKFKTNAYKVSGGLHGVGVAAVNAASARLEATVWRDGYRWEVVYEKGVLTSPTRQVGPQGDRRGTRIRFWPDPTILKHVRDHGTNAFDGEQVRRRCAEVAALNPGLVLTVVDERDATSQTFHSPEGLISLVRREDPDPQDSDAPPRIPTEPLRFSGVEMVPVEGGEPKRIEVEVSLAWRASRRQERILAFTNGVPQPDGGEHVVGMNAGLHLAFQAFAREQKGKDLQFKPEDLREQLVAVISVRMPDPKYDSQTKRRLSSNEVRGPVLRIVRDGVREWLERNPSEGRAVLEMARAAAKHREQMDSLRAARWERRRADEGVAALPGKLADCESRNPAECELFLVEGDSAGGSAKQGRDRRFQAILALRGKLMNVWRQDPSNAFRSEQVGTIATALRCGFGKDLDLKRLRYHKIILMTDADVDGAHIRVLLLTLFFQFFRPLLEEGHIYAARPPLYRWARRGSVSYLADDAALTRLLLETASEDCVARIGGTELRGAPLWNALEEALPAAEAITAWAASGVPLPVADALAASGALVDPARLADAARRLSEAASDGESWRAEAGQLFRRADGAEDVFNLAELSAQSGADRVRALAPWNLALAGGEIHRKDRTWRATGPAGIIALARQAAMEGAQIQRYKGLGEMNPEQLWETTMDPEARVLERLTLDDGAAAEAALERLMGEETQGRKDLIESIDATTLDMEAF